MSVFKVLIYLSLLLVFVGCNSSTNSKVETEQPIEIESAVEHVPQYISCSGLAKIDFIEATAISELDDYVASNVIDSKFITESRWSTDKHEQFIILTLEDFALIKGLSLTWLNTDERSYSYDVEVSQDKVTWLSVIASQVTDPSSSRSQFIEIPEHTSRYVKIIPKGSSFDSTSHLVEVEAFGCLEDVSSTIELDDWYLSIPVDEKSHSKAKSIYESTLTNNYFNAQFFFLNTQGGLVFRAPIEGAKTSSNTKYTRTELREMLRRGNTDINVQGINKNNWIFSSAPNYEHDKAAGIDGDLVVDLAVNHVTETGDDSQIGRVIIGQIHANDDEPIRVYYRKLPNNSKGSIYLAHEIEGGDDIYRELIGTRSRSAPNPTNGIELNERFGYQIKVIGNLLTLIITREGHADISETLDMTDSGYDQGGQYMYFKAGVYNQNNSGNSKDYVQATFYKIENNHTGYLAE